ncbi:MAG: hypothetical protein IT536_13810 [Hyphomicrobiales bacterium]|nr:hypothetical protein [Hyphomicrobiales bacterium]
MEAVAIAAADRAVRTTLLTLGIDIGDHRALREAQLDFQHLRAWRESTEAVKRKALLTAVAVIVSGALGYLWLALRGAPH